MELFCNLRKPPEERMVCLQLLGRLPETGVFSGLDCPLARSFNYRVKKAQMTGPSFSEF